MYLLVHFSKNYQIHLSSKSIHIRIVSILLQKKQIDLQAQVFYARYNFSGGSETTNLISPGKYTATRKSYESHPHGLKSLLKIEV